MRKNIRCPDCECTAFHINRISENKYELKCWSQRKCTKYIRVFTTKDDTLQDLK